MTSPVSDLRADCIELRDHGCDPGGFAPRVLAVLDDYDELREALRDLLTPIEGQWGDQDHRDLAAVWIRRLLGLCQSRGCDQPRLADPDAEGYCAECLDVDPAPPGRSSLGRAPFCPTRPRRPRGGVTVPTR